MTLSDKKEPIIANKKGKSFVYGYSYPEEDVKEFIEKLTEIAYYDSIKKCYLIKLKDVLNEAGSELI